MKTFASSEIKKTRSKGNFKEVIAKLSRGLMLPVAMLPIAGLFLGLGATITNLSNNNSAMKIFGQVFSIPGNAIFGALPVLFAIAIAISFTNDSGTAGLSALVGWLIFNAIQASFIVVHKEPHADPTGYSFLWYNFTPSEFGSIFSSNIGIQSLSTSVFGGACVGGVTAFLYNRFKNIKLPVIIGFFNGVRFIPIITFVCSMLVGLLFAMAWPIIGIGLYNFGMYLGQAPYGSNSFVFGLFERALVPFGLHHAFYAPLWYTTAGGQFNLGSTPYLDGVAITTYNGQAITNWFDLIFTVGGKTAPTDWNSTTNIAGDQNLWMFVRNYLCGLKVSTDGTHYMTIKLDNYYRLFNSGGVTGNPGQYMQGKFPFMIFGLPMAALAMIFLVPKNTDNRKQAMAIIGSSALTCLLTGITEPLEFTFLFLAPWLFWGIHAPLCALSFWIMNIVNAHIGMTFSGGLIDFIVYGVLPDVSSHGANCYMVPIIGGVLAPIYYLLFRNLILHFDIKTPGRDSEVRMFTKADYKEKINATTTPIQSSESKVDALALAVIKAYGGRENIRNVDACITKLRVQVVNPDIVNKDELVRLGARGVMKPSPQSVYAVFGVEADSIKNNMNDILRKG